MTVMATTRSQPVLPLPAEGEQFGPWMLVQRSNRARGARKHTGIGLSTATSQARSADRKAMAKVFATWYGPIPEHEEIETRVLIKPRELTPQLKDKGKSSVEPNCVLIQTVLGTTKKNDGKDGKSQNGKAYVAVEKISPSRFSTLDRSSFNIVETTNHIVPVTLGPDSANSPLVGKVTAGAGSISDVELDTLGLDLDKAHSIEIVSASLENEARPKLNLDNANAPPPSKGQIIHQVVSDSLKNVKHKKIASGDAPPNATCHVILDQIVQDINGKQKIKMDISTLHKLVKETYSKMNNSREAGDTENTISRQSNVVSSSLPHNQTPPDK